MVLTSGITLRGVKWFEGEFSLPYKLIQIEGPEAPGSDNSRFFTTFAALYPDYADKGVYAVFQALEYLLTGPLISTTEVAALVEALMSTDDQFQNQTEVDERFSGMTDDQRWERACVDARSLALPVAMLVFGKKAHEPRVGYLLCGAATPPGMAVDAFRQARLGQVKYD